MCVSSYCSSSAFEISEKALALKSYSDVRLNSVPSDTQQIFDISATVNPSYINFRSISFGISNVEVLFPVTFCEY